MEKMERSTETKTARRELGAEAHVGQALYLVSLGGLGKRAVKKTPFLASQMPQTL